jgi:hypothetical protein
MPIPQEDIMPLNPPVGTTMWKVTVEALMVPCIEPFPIMFRLISLIFIVPDMPLPLWVTLQVIFPWPLVSADVPVHVPDTLASVPVDTGVGVAGEELDPPHADTATRLTTARIDRRMAHSPLGLCEIAEMGCPSSHYNRFTELTSGDTWSEPLLAWQEHGP